MLNSPPSSHSPSKQEIQQGIHKGILFGGGSIFLIGLAGFFLLQQDWISPDLWNALQQADQVSFILGWVLMCFAIFILGYRWKVLLPKSDEISGGFLGISLGGALLLNYAVPGPFGELVAAWMLKKRYGIPITIGITTGGVARLLGLLTAALGTIIFWFFVEPSWKETEFLLWGLVLGISLGTGLLLALFFLPQKMLLLLSSRESKLSSLLKSFLNSIISCTENGILPLFYASGWSIIGHGIAFLGIWFSLQAILPTDSLIGVIFTYLAGTCCGAIAFLIPGSQLAWDAIFTGLLASSTQYSIEEAAILTGVLRIEQLGMMIIGGIGLLVLLFQGSKSSASKI